jgi:hypothetical protein
MNLNDIIHTYHDRFKEKHRKTTTTQQWSALNAMRGCRSGQYGEVALACEKCEWTGTVFQSCGHRACNQCQSHLASQWLARQQNKLLPVKYFMVTFTIPYQLRRVALANQALFYSLMFNCATATLKQFAKNDKELQCELGMTGVLHTHSRQLNYHPHIHFIVPAGGLNKARNEWRKRKGPYLFKEQNLAKVYRAMLLKALKENRLQLPYKLPKEWIVDCEHVGQGLPALKYLSRYLYKGVLSNNNIVSDDGTSVTFNYIDSQSGKTKKRKLSGEDFIALLLQHALPKGFRRSRDFGFLHGNAKKRLRLIQYLLQMILPKFKPPEKPCFTCKTCQHPLSITGFIRPKPVPG